MVEQLGLGPVLGQPIDTLSKGFKRRVGLAQAVLHDPDVLILDEPTDGLDPNQKREVRGLIRDMAQAKAIIISTHLLEEVDAVCTRAMLINKGKIVVDCTPDDLERVIPRNDVSGNSMWFPECQHGIAVQIWNSFAMYFVSGSTIKFKISGTGFDIHTGLS